MLNTDKACKLHQINAKTSLPGNYYVNNKAERRVSFPRWNALVTDGINTGFPLIVTKCATFMPSRNACGMISEWKHDVVFS